MNDIVTYSILKEIVGSLDMPIDSTFSANFADDDRLASCFPVSHLAAASIGSAAIAISNLVGIVAAQPSVVVSHRLASLWFGWSIKPIGWELPGAWDAVAGDYRTQDGWIKIHTNAPHHRAAALSVLGCEADRQKVASVIATWSAGALEDAIIDKGGCAARLMTPQSWLAHPQGIAVGQEPLMQWDGPGHHDPMTWKPTTGRPLAGLRVLDLTRVLAGPVATRFLAGFGADVLRIDPYEWEEPAVAPEVTLGKRCARLNLKTQAGHQAFVTLLAKADVLIHGYRGDALERLGLGADVRQLIRPGLIDISLNAYGHTGPWANRRGFDSLVQFSSGISSDGMTWRGSPTPVSLPVQALDHATGYMLAAAAVRGGISRLTGTGPTRARLSLARVAKLLMDHKGDATAHDFAPSMNADFDDAIENTDWGPAMRLTSPMNVTGAAMYWERPASKLGSATPQW